MTPDDLRLTLMEMAVALDRDDEAEAEKKWTSLTVSDRYPIVVLLLAAADKPVKKKRAAQILRCSLSNLSPSADSDDLESELNDALLESAESIWAWLLGGLKSKRTLADAEKQVEQMKNTVHELRESLEEHVADIQVLEHEQEAMAALVRLAHEVNVDAHREEVRKTATVHDLPTKLTSIQEPTDD